MNKLRTFLFLSLLISACSDSSESSQDQGNEDPTSDLGKEIDQIFRFIPSDASGLDFYNTLSETQEYNYFKFQYTYNGAGVAIGDIDNDGLDDIYLVGNQVKDKLFLNKGGLKFEDISLRAGIENEGGFNFGVTMVDINADGYQDIYVCRSGHDGLGKERANLLYINNQDQTFTESASAYGLADIGHSIQSAFFDYDNDGDLDVYLTNHPVDYGQNLGQRLEKMKNPGEYEMDRLYENNGNNTFTDVTRKAGLVNYGHGLGLIIWDVNRDGWDDIIVANDYQSSDWIYLNDQDGTFTDQMKDLFPHIPYYSMGIDAADINNDGLMDLKIVEMLPENYKRRLVNLSDLSEKNYYVFNDVGFHHQYTRNGFFLNSGMDHFGDIALMTGMDATDWSWSTLIADFDNDGLQDVFVSNGYLRDMQDKDYIKKAKVFKDQGQAMSKEEFNKICKSQKIRNYLFKNEGGLQFSSIAKESGLKERSFSNGAAYSDLDNDGDLDLVINNVNLQLEPDPVFLYENLSSDGRNYIKVEFDGPANNPGAEGVQVEIDHQGETMIRELRRTRGFESAVPDYLLFGIGDRKTVESMRIIWPDGKYEELTQVEGGSTIMAQYSDARLDFETPKVRSLFETSQSMGIDFLHKDKVLNEFDFEKQLPFRLGMQGPGACTGDVNNDGLDDMFITGSHEQSSALYIQGNSGFSVVAGPWDQFSADEGTVAEFTDVDNDGDLDLFVGAGGIERGKSHEQYLDKLYYNDGSGHFDYRADALPRMLSSTSCIAFGDMDGDGDEDAFIGVRSVPGSYGKAPVSFLLRNDEGKFKSAATLAQGMNELGMVCDAQWADIDNDNDLDLIVVGEWQAPHLFLNESGKLTLTTSWLPDLRGFWRSILCHDLDGDGQVEIVLGNSGTNSKYNASQEAPLRMYLGDIDTNGKKDIVLAYKQGNYYHPDRTFTYLRDQFPILNRKFTYYEDAAGKSLEQIFGTGLSRAELHEVNELKSVILKRNGEKFEAQALPRMAQISFINAILAEDVDQDGDKDLIVAGNELYTPIQTGSYDAGIGSVLINDGSGVFSAIHPKKAGLRLKGWVKGMSFMNMQGERTLCAWRNKDSLLFYRMNSKELTLP